MTHKKPGLGQVRGQSWEGLPRPGEAGAKGRAGKSILRNGEGKVVQPKGNLADRILGIVQKMAIYKKKKKKSNNSLCFST